MIDPVITCHLAGAPGRCAVESFIQNVFAEHFGATLCSVMPELVSLADADGTIAAAAGLRTAESGPLFIEQYCDSPVEHVLGERTGQRIARSRIIEVGNLATRSPGSARLFFTAMTRHLHDRGFDWVVFAGTTDVRAVFRRMSIELVTLCTADGARLGAARRDWGSYYDNRPLVLAGSIAAGCRQLGLTRAIVPKLSDLACLAATPVPCPG